MGAGLNPPFQHCRFSMIKAVIFDIDDTMISTSRANAHCRSLALDLLEKQIDEAERPELERIEKHLYKIFGWARMKDMWAAICREVGAPVPDDDVLINIENRFQEDFSNQVQPLETVVSTIEALRDRAMPNGIISDGHFEWQMAKLEVAGLKQYFVDDSIRISIQSDLKSCKPSSFNFRAHEKRLGLRRNELLYIGDKPWDIIGANNRGWVSVLTRQAWPDRENHWPQPKIRLERPDYTVDTMAGLLEVIDGRES